VRQGLRKLHFKLQLFPAIVLLLLSISLYVPPIISFAPIIGIRSLLTAAIVFLTLIWLCQFRTELIQAIPHHLLLVAFIFPIYLLIYGAVSGTVGLALFGNSDRSLGAITYFTCSVFFVFGYLLKKVYPDAIGKIFVYLGIFQLIVFATNFFGHSTDARQGSFFNTNPNSLLTGLILVYLLTWFVETKSTLSPTLVGLVFILSILLLVWIGALQSIIGFLVVFFIYLLAKVTRRSAIQFIHIVTAFVTISAIFVAFTVFTKLPSQRQSNSNSWDERLEIYKTSFSMVSEKFLFGFGVDHFNLGYYKWSLAENIKLVDNAHSIPFQLISTIGLFGLFIFFGLFFVVLKRSYVVSNPISNTIRNVILFYLISGLFAIQTPSVEFIVFLLLGHLSNSKYSKTHKKAEKKLIGVTLASTALVGMITVSFHLYPLVKISQAISDDSRNLSQSSLQIRQNFEKIYDLGLLNTVGSYSIFVNDKDLGLVILQRMINISDIDQRTIALALVMSQKFDDKNLENLGDRMNTLARI
jgi:O-antigen ligase